MLHDSFLHPLLGSCCARRLWGCCQPISVWPADCVWRNPCPAHIGVWRTSSVCWRVWPSCCRPGSLWSAEHFWAVAWLCGSSSARRRLWRLWTAAAAASSGWQPLWRRRRLWVSLGVAGGAACCSCSMLSAPGLHWQDCCMPISTPLRPSRLPPLFSQRAFCSQPAAGSGFGGFGGALPTTTPKPAGGAMWQMRK